MVWRDLPAQKRYRCAIVCVSYLHPATTVKQGETLGSILNHDRVIRHEFSIGNTEEQVKYAETMRKMPTIVTALIA